jgi:nicotinamide riboside kinase
MTRAVPAGAPGAIAAPSAAPPVRRIAVIGAECVGKTALCEALAARLPGLWLPEYLREFCAAHARPPRRDEQARILATQVEREAATVADAARTGIGWVLCDSAPVITALCSVHYFDDHSLLAPALAHHRHYAATLLLLPDLPWVADGIQRDGPQVRALVHESLVALLARAGIAAQLIGGSGSERIALAVAALERLATHRPI